MSCFSGPLAAVPPVAIATAVRCHNHGPLSAAALGPLPNYNYQGRCPPPLLRTAVCRHYRSCCPPPLSRTAVCRCYDRPLSAAAIAQTNHPVNTNLALCVMLLLQTASRRYSLTTGRCRSRGLLAAVALANRWTPLLSRTACRLVHPPPATAAQVACRISVP